jgi:hypothetical protein
VFQTNRQPHRRMFLVFDESPPPSAPASPLAVLAASLRLPMLRRVICWSLMFASRGFASAAYCLGLVSSV